MYKVTRYEYVTGKLAIRHYRSHYKTRMKAPLLLSLLLICCEALASDDGPNKARRLRRGGVPARSSNKPSIGVAGGAALSRHLSLWDSIKSLAGKATSSLVGCGAADTTHDSVWWVLGKRGEHVPH